MWLESLLKKSTAITLDKKVTKMWQVKRQKNVAVDHRQAWYKAFRRKMIKERTKVIPYATYKLSFQILLIRTRTCMSIRS